MPAAGWGLRSLPLASALPPRFRGLSWNRPAGAGGGWWGPAGAIGQGGGLELPPPTDPLWGASAPQQSGAGGRLPVEVDKELKVLAFGGAHWVPVAAGLQDGGTPRTPPECLSQDRPEQTWSPRSRAALTGPTWPGAPVVNRVLGALRQVTAPLWAWALSQGPLPKEAPGPSLAGRLSLKGQLGEAAELPGLPASGP